MRKTKRVEAPNFEIEQNAPNVHAIRFKTDVRAGWEQWVLLTGDRHHDNVDANWDLERRHLEIAKKRGAIVIDVGDLFCAMQGRYDPRSNLDKLRPELKVSNYLDKLIETAAEFYGPYAPNFVVFGRGNHETKIRERHGVDLTDLLVHHLRTEHGGRCYAGGYGGWVRFMFTLNKTRRESRVLHYFHGAGGGGPVTRGVIQTNRMSAYLLDADYVVSGHTHDQWVMPIKRIGLSHGGKIVQRLCYHIRTPSYKDEWKDGLEGWAVEKGHNPKPQGCVWMRFWIEGDVIRESITTDLI